MFNGVSTNTTNNLQIQLGTSGGFVITGYVSQATNLNASPTTASATSGFLITSSIAAADLYSGIITIDLFNSGVYVYNGLLSKGGLGPQLSVGIIQSLGGVLSQIRITTLAGTATFDAGSINILYE
jgi:hypothetical protein